MLKTLFTMILMIIFCEAQGQLDGTIGGTDAAQARVEINEMIDQAMRDTKWSKARLKCNGRRLVLKGKRESISVKRVVRTRSNGTLDRLTLKPFTSGPKALQATFVNERLIHAQWISKEKDGPMERPVQKTYVNGQLVVLSPNK
jgi:hypothetical protein